MQSAILLHSTTRWTSRRSCAVVSPNPFGTASYHAQKLSFLQIESKWRQKWADAAKSRDTGMGNKPKCYVLPMFAYPSGNLHMGHLRVYTISDVIARYKRMRGCNVVHPTGWDAFGLPAENAAIARGIDPVVWTRENISRMKAQLISMNASFDWDREINTCSPTFYKHTQKIFLMLHERGLAYQAEAMVNYDPVDKTVLANEQVDSSGRSWRSGALVQQIKLKQWFFRITAFKDALLEDLDALTRNNKWPERVIMQQRNWLGRSEGALIHFDIEGSPEAQETISVFTTRPDTLFGVTYLALSMSHPLVQRIAKDYPMLQAFLDRMSSFSPDTKEGFELPGLSAYNPINILHGDAGPQSRKVPVFVAPYVLDGYGEGAVMGVPAHDARDFDFWKQNRPKDKIPVAVVSDEHGLVSRKRSETFTGSGFLTQICGPYAGLPNQAAGRKIVADLSAHNLAKVSATWRLRDWLVSRQRYWGTPIPIVHCNTCGAVPVPARELPVELPILNDNIRAMSGNPLENHLTWKHVKCPRCDGPAQRDTDTMDTFVDSSWYYLRFADALNNEVPFSSAAVKDVLPVDTYVGGVEHAILHLLYARFIYKFLASVGLIQDGSQVHEPFQQLVTQGMVQGKTFSDPHTGRFLLPAEIQLDDSGRPIIKATRLMPNMSWEKMSKSKHNGVSPESCISKYGADVTRAHMLFAAPVSDELQWDEEKIVGIERWFHKISRLVSAFADVSEGRTFRTPSANQLSKTLTANNVEIFLLTQNTIKSVTRTLETNIYGLNTVVSDLVKLTNALIRADHQDMELWNFHDSISTVTSMLAPIAPAFAEQCWEDLHAHRYQPGSIFEAGWPEFTLTPELEAELLLRTDQVNCALQVNGKLRCTIPLPARITKDNDRSAAEEMLLEHVLNHADAQYWLTQKNDWEQRKKVIVVGQGKLINVVF